MKRYIKPVSYFLVLIFLLIYLIVERENVMTAIDFSVDYSLSTLIPSLFPMIFISCVFINSPAKKIVSKLFSPVCRCFFRLSSACACPIIFGMLFGYPVGAKLTSIALKNGEISEQEASRLLLFCINPGFPFCVIFVGGSVFRNINIGIYIFVSTVIASLLTGYIFSFGQKLNKEQIRSQKSLNLTEILSQSATNSLSSTLTMCLYISIFSCFSSLLRYIISYSGVLLIPVIDTRDITSTVFFIFEVTRGIINSVNMSASLTVIVFGIAFAGICVHMQVFSLFKFRINFRKFYISRVIYSIITVLSFSTISYFCPIEQAVMSSFSLSINKGTSTASLSLVLLVCSYIYMNKSVEKNKNLC